MQLFLLLFPVVHSIIIKTDQGVIKGKEFIANDGSLVHIFKHVPYARPPIGELRFSLPEITGSWKGIRDATKYGPACMSNSTTSKSPQKWVDEDCLHNNIFVSDRCLKSKKGCPIVLYIHGGGFNYDSAVMFNDTVLINNFGSKDVVLIIVGFRLGFFGLITFPDGNAVPRNLPIYDIVQSLHWIQENIDSYGGNKKSVTLLGHSGGGTAVAALAFSKSIDPKRKLFHRGIIMSGLAIMDREECISVQKAFEFSERAGCIKYKSRTSPTDNYVQEIVDCLKGKTGLELLAVQRKMEEEGYEIEGLIVEAPLFPGKQLANFFNNAPKIPLMIGTTLREMDDWEEIDVSVDIANFLEFRHPQRASEKFNKDVKAGVFKSTSPHTQTQTVFIGTYRMAAEATKSGADVYLYSYRNKKHSIHTDDLSYLMGVHPFEMDENEQVLARLYPSYFINYIKTGIPDKEWEPFRLADSNYFAIDINVTSGLRPKNEDGYEKKLVDYWFKNLTVFDQSLRPMNGEKKRAVFPTAIEPKSLLIPTPTISFNWFNFFVITAVLIFGYCLGRFSTPTSRQMTVYYPQESTPLFYKEDKN